MPTQPPTLVELLLRQREAWEQGQPLRVEEVLAAHPSFRDNPDAVLDLVYNEIILREERGETPVLAEYLERFPHLSEPLRLQFEIDQAITEESSSLGSSLPSTFQLSPAAEPGEFPKLPGCEILGELGRGAMGVVYRAWQPGPNRIVALKVLSPNVPPARVRTEAEAVARLQHPNIVQVFEVKEHAGRTALVLEFVGGGNLAQKIDGKPQPPREAARLVETLARATGHAHERAVVHRDLKPSNILLAGSPDAPLGNCEPKISDFGLAKLLTGGANLTHTTDVLGTPSYMAPEQAEGKKDVGPLIDVYSLGAILYELLTGRPPFLGATVLDTLAQVRGQDPVPPRRLQPRVPRDLETICLECLHKSPKRRYISAAALAGDLRAFLEGRPIAARPAGPVERLVKWARRRPAAALGLAVGTTAAVLLVLGGVHFTRQVQQQRDLAERRADELKVQLSRTRKLLYTAQLLRVGGVWEADPNLALTLLEDEASCPLDLRDFSWGVFHSRCKRFRLELNGHTRKVSALAYRPDGSLLASGSHDGTVRFWDPASGAEMACLHEHTHRVTALACSPDNRLTASGSSDGAVKLWLESSFLTDLLPPERSSKVVSLCFSPDGKILAVHLAPTAVGLPEGRGCGKVSLWDVHSRKCRLTLAEATEAGCNLAVSPEGLLACGSEQGVWLWDLHTGKVRQTLRGHKKPVLAVAFSPDGQVLASGGADETLRLWNRWTGDLLAALETENGPVSALAYSPDGLTLAVASETPLDPFGNDAPRPVVLWDAARMKPRELLRGHRASVSALAFSPEATGPGRPPKRGTLATGGADRSIKLWDAVGRPLRVELEKHVAARPGSAGSSVALSADGSTLAWVSRAEENAGRLAGRGVEVTVWESERAKVRSRLQGHLRPIRCLALSADGNTVATAAGGPDEPVELKLWDAGTGRELRSLVGHSSSVQALAFGPDSRTLVSGSWDRTVRLWDVVTGRELRVLAGPSWSVSAVAFSPDGQMVAACGGQSGEQGEAHTWEVSSGRPLARWTVPGLATCLAFAADGRTLALGTREGRLGIYRAADGEERLVFESGIKGLSCLALHPDGVTLAVAGSGPAVKLWDLEMAQERASLPGHSGGVCLLAFSHKGQLLTSASAAGTARLWYSHWK